MTSLLRRKHPITVRSMSSSLLRALDLQRLLITGIWLVAALLWGCSILWCAAATAEQSDGTAAALEDSSVEAASFSVGRGGTRLKWLPRRTSSASCGSSGSCVLPTEHATVQEPSETTAPPAEVFAEPFDEGVPQDTRTPKKAQPPKSPLKEQLERELAARRYELPEKCPSAKDLKSISELSKKIVPPEGDLPQDCPLFADTFRPRSFAPITYTWTASALCHKPLYFEDVQLERYGHMAGPWVQPFASFAHFFLTVPILPYKMGLELPHECIYTLGYYRPGNCAPYMLDPLPLSVRAALFEAGAWVGGCFAFP